MARLAAAQHGVVSAAQLAALGLDASAIKRAVAKGSLHRLHRGVYAVGHPEITFHGRLLAALLAIGPGTVAGLRSAAALWEFRRDEGGPVDVLTTRSVAGRDGIRVHRTRSLPRADTTRHHRVPTTTPARTLLDLADVLGPWPLRRAVRQAEVDRRVSQSALADQLARANGRRGAAKLAAIVAHGAMPTRSGLEDRVADLIDAAGLPRPLTNAKVGPFEVDLLFPEQRLIVEVDGARYHETPQARRADAERDAALEALGHRTLRVTEEEAGRPEEAMARVRAALHPHRTAG